MRNIQHNDPILLRTRENRFLNTDNGIGPEVKMTVNNNRNPAISDEVWFVERLAGDGVVQHNDPILLRTRENRFLNTDNGTGPEVKMTVNNNRNPAISDEIWFVERLAGNGIVQHNDPILLRTRENRFLNTDNGTGPEVKMTVNNNRNPAISDEIWFVERLAGNGIVQHNDPILLRTRENRFLNTDNGTGPEVKMTVNNNRNPAISDEIWFVERLAGNGIVQHNDPILLRTRENRFLNTDNGTGPEVKMTVNNNRNPAISDEIWFVERLAGNGIVQHNDPILLRTRENRFLNTDNGTGPEVKMTVNNNRNPAISDEIWFVERLAGNGIVQHNDPILLRTRENRFLNTDNGTGPEVKMTVNNNRNPAISDEIWFVERAVFRFPISGQQEDKLGNSRKMRTRITISDTGRIDAVTKTRTKEALRGFHGTVVVLLTDEEGNILYESKPHTYGVNGEAVLGSPSEREEPWSEEFPREILGQLAGYKIIHFVDPKRTLEDTLSEFNRILDQLVSANRKIRDISREWEEQEQPVPQA
ncbi:fascin domain-containing protein [Paenibacillus alkalitolerans]|uniref:fascin domain-containing protein n=1 Tax=Paenibacillus alkalitolerans TaxID=2799335 RepID=UPI0018F3D178|nr:hypothetical protein [Paenibacillus alkalitolerans]